VSGEAGQPVRLAAKSWKQLYISYYDTVQCGSILIEPLEKVLFFFDERLSLWISTGVKLGKAWCQFHRSCLAVSSSRDQS
jgi:hypothetical protein